MKKKGKVLLTSQCKAYVLRLEMYVIYTLELN